MYKIWLLLLGLTGLTYKLASLKFALVLLLASIVKILWDMGVLKSIKFSRGFFQPCRIYYMEFKGNYKNIGNEIERFQAIRYKMNLNTLIYPLFGIFYDDPKKVDPN